MRKRELLKAIEGARANAQREISGNVAAGSGNLYARGLSAEGYAGGYRDAMDDMINLLNGVRPNRYPYWKREE